MHGTADNVTENSENLLHSHTQQPPYPQRHPHHANASNNPSQHHQHSHVHPHHPHHYHQHLPGAPPHNPHHMPPSSALQQLTSSVASGFNGIRNGLSALGSGAGAAAVSAAAAGHSHVGPHLMPLSPASIGLHGGATHGHLHSATSSAAHSASSVLGGGAISAATANSSAAAVASNACTTTANSGSGSSGSISSQSPPGGVVASSVSAAPNPMGSAGGLARDCAGCRKRITERFMLKALDLFWHEDCLKCGCCDCRLGEVGSTLYNRANLILCKRDYLRLFGTTGYCAACNKVIPAFEMVMRAKSNVYHLECFACQQCNHRFCVGDRFYLCDNKILCEYDYEERLVFANMAYNPSSLAHIRRQVSSLQPASDSSMNGGHGHSPSAVTAAAVASAAAQQRNSTGGNGGPGGGSGPGGPGGPAMGGARGVHNEKLSAVAQNMHAVLAPGNLAGGPAVAGAGGGGGGIIGGGGHLRGDDGSSGYGSPDSETFEAPPAAQ